MTEASDNDDLFGSDVSSEGGKAEPMNVSPSKQQDTNSTTDVLDLFGEESDGDEAVTRRAVVVQEEDEEDMEDGQAADEDEFGYFHWPYLGMLYLKLLKQWRRHGRGGRTKGRGGR